MRIIFMGTPEFAVPSLEALLSSGKDVVAVVTQPDRPKGRGQKVTFSPVKEKALQHELPLYQPEKLDTEEGRCFLKALRPDLIVVTAFGQLLSEAILSLPVYGCINVHASLLPAFRGAAPIHRVIIEGKQETGVTIMQMVKELDAGAMYLQVAVPITDDDTLGSVHDKLASCGGDALLQVIAQLEEGTAKAIPQEERLVNYAAKITKKEVEIDWNKSAREIWNLVRGTNPFPGAYTYLEQKLWKIWRTTILSDQVGTPGQITIHKAGIVVGTGEGSIILQEIQPENSKRMQASDYLKGHKIPADCMFGKK